MKIAFIVLGVLLFPVALIAIALALPVKLKALYGNGTLDLRLTYLFYTYSEYATGQEKPDLSEILRKLKAKKKRKGKKPKKAVKKAAASREPETIKETFGVLLALVRDVLFPIIRAERFKIFVKKLKIDVGGKDAADTAVVFGAVTASVNALLGFLYENFRVRFGKKKDRYIVPRYDLEKTDADIHVVFSMSLFHVLTSVVPELSKHVEL